MTQFPQAEAAIDPHKRPIAITIICIIGFIGAALTLPAVRCYEPPRGHDDVHAQQLPRPAGRGQPLRDEPRRGAAGAVRAHHQKDAVTVAGDQGSVGYRYRGR